MAHSSYRLPTNIEQGVVGGAKFKTVIPPGSTGLETRVIEWDECRYEGNIAYATQVAANIAPIDKHFRRVRGMAHSFPFKDWNDFATTVDGTNLTADVRQKLGTGDGAEATWQLVKNYILDVGGNQIDDEDLGYTFNILLPVSGTVSIWVANTLKTETTHYTVDYLTGLVTFTSGNIPTGGQNIEAVCQFDRKCRYDTDHLKIRKPHDARHANIPSIPIVELL